MQTLRHAHSLARFVLAWFVLSIGMAIASPIVAPKSMELVCSTSSVVKLIIKGETGTQKLHSHSLDCPLCGVTGAPPPAVAMFAPTDLPLGRLLQSIPAARIAAITAAPLPPRGPPALS